MSRGPGVQREDCRKCTLPGERNEDFSGLLERSRLPGLEMRPAVWVAMSGACTSTVPGEIEVGESGKRMTARDVSLGSFVPLVICCYV